MKKQALLNYVLATIIVVLLFYIRTSAEFTESNPLELSLPGSTDCNYSAIGGFTPGKPIDAATARTQTAAFQEFASRQNMSIVGGVISKAAIDSLLCGGTYNGIAYQFAMDPTGKTGPANAISIVLGAVKVQDVDRTPTITSQGTSYYSNNLWCPPSCMVF